MVTEVEALLSFIFNEELRLPGVEGVTSEGYNTEGGFHICPNSALVDLLDQGYLRRKDAMCLKFQELKEGLLPSDSDRLQLARRSWACAGLGHRGVFVRYRRQGRPRHQIPILVAWLNSGLA